MCTKFYFSALCLNVCLKALVCTVRRDLRRRCALITACIVQVTQWFAMLFLSKLESICCSWVLQLRISIISAPRMLPCTNTSRQHCSTDTQLFVLFLRYQYFHVISYMIAYTFYIYQNISKILLKMMKYD